MGHPFDAQNEIARCTARSIHADDHGLPNRQTGADIRGRDSWRDVVIASQFFTRACTQANRQDRVESRTFGAELVKPTYRSSVDEADARAVHTAIAATRPVRFTESTQGVARHRDKESAAEVTRIGPERQRTVRIDAQLEGTLLSTETIHKYSYRLACRQGDRQARSAVDTLLDIVIAGELGPSLITNIEDGIKRRVDRIECVGTRAWGGEHDFRFRRFTSATATELQAGSTRDSTLLRRKCPRKVRAVLGGRRCRRDKYCHDDRPQKEFDEAAR